MSSQYKGVRARGSNKFIAYMDMGGKQYQLGQYPQEQQAARARDKYVVT